jgi:hypothetical protein
MSPLKKEKIKNQKEKILISYVLLLDF